MGLTYFKRFRMDLDLRRPLFSPDPLPPGYRLLAWRESLLDSHAEAKFRSFQFEIDANVFPCLGERDRCQRLMEEIASRPGFFPAATWLLVYSDGTLPEQIEPCGTVQGIVDHEGYGAIQNLGIAPGHRGHGLGTYLMYQAAQGFRNGGIDAMTLEVTSQNVGAVRLYQRLGFRKVRTVYKAVQVACV